MVQVQACILPRLYWDWRSLVEYPRLFCARAFSRTKGNTFPLPALMVLRLTDERFQFRFDAGARIMICQGTDISSMDNDLLGTMSKPLF